MRKTLLTLLFVIIVTTLASCVLSPKNSDAYAVKVVFTDTGDPVFEGTYYIKDSDDYEEEGNEFFYNLYTDEACKTLSDICLLLCCDYKNDKDILVSAAKIAPLHVWYSMTTQNYGGKLEYITDNNYVTWIQTQSTTPFLALSGNSGWNSIGNIKIYANKTVELRMSTEGPY